MGRYWRNLENYEIADIWPGTRKPSVPLVLLSPWAPFLLLILPSSTLLSYLTKYIFNISKCFEVQSSVYFGALRSYSVMWHVISILKKNAHLSHHLKQDLQGFSCTPERDGGRHSSGHSVCVQGRQAGRKTTFPEALVPALFLVVSQLSLMDAPSFKKVWKKYKQDFPPSTYNERWQGDRGWKSHVCSQSTVNSPRRLVMGKMVKSEVTLHFSKKKKNHQMITLEYSVPWKCVQRALLIRHMMVRWSCVRQQPPCLLWQAGRVGHSLTARTPGPDDGGWLGVSQLGMQTCTPFSVTCLTLSSAQNLHKSCPLTVIGGWEEVAVCLRRTKRKSRDLRSLCSCSVRIPSWLFSSALSFPQCLQWYQFLCFLSFSCGLCIHLLLLWASSQVYTLNRTKKIETYYCPLCFHFLKFLWTSLVFF